MSGKLMDKYEAASRYERAVEEAMRAVARADELDHALSLVDDAVYFDHYDNRDAYANVMLSVRKAVENEHATNVVTTQARIELCFDPASVDW